MDEFLTLLLTSTVKCIAFGLGYSCEVDGNIVTIGGIRSLRVVRECLGYNAFQSLSVVALILVATNWRKLNWLGRAVVLLASPFVAFASNVVRVVCTAFVGYAWAGIADAFHDYFGYVTFLLGMFVLFAITDKLSDWKKRRDGADEKRDKDKQET